MRVGASSKLMVYGLNLQRTILCTRNFATMTRWLAVDILIK
jgi:hypothetical protein